MVEHKKKKILVLMIIFLAISSLQVVMANDLKANAQVVKDRDKYYQTSLFDDFSQIAREDYLGADYKELFPPSGYQYVVSGSTWFVTASGVEWFPHGAVYWRNIDKVYSYTLKKL